MLWLLLFFSFWRFRKKQNKKNNNINCSGSIWLPVSCSPLQRKASTSWRFWFPAMRRVPSSGKEVRPSSSCRRRLEPPSNCQNPKTSTPVRRRCPPRCWGWMDGWMDGCWCENKKRFQTNQIKMTMTKCQNLRDSGKNRNRPFPLCITVTQHCINYKFITPKKRADINCHSKSPDLSLGIY